MDSYRTPLNANDISVIVVDDAKFTCEMIRRILKAAGFHDIRLANSAQQALDMMRQRRANILLADWLMPEMDGLTLTKRVRQVDEEANHYTYIILLTAREGVESLTEAFNQGVDDFINKSPDNKELLARTHAAGRISQLQNDLLKANRRLLELNRQLEERNSFDVVTGLGNRAYLERQLDNLLRHTESRGGAACMALIRVNEFDLLRRRHGDKVCGEIIEATANRLQQTVRPLDIVTRIDEAEFGVLMCHDNPDHCHPNAFRRIHQALNLRAYKTRAGFVTVTSAIAICGITPRSDERQAPDDIVDYVHAHLDEAHQSGRVLMVKWRG
jgi:diguanylate cyclase (GGDEF)-like protein